MNHPLHLEIPSHAGPAFAWYHPAKSASSTGVVLCPPLGSEYMQSYRSLRTVANGLAARGVAVVRVDYHGTGDSAGSDFSARRVDAWLASIDAAIEALRRVSGVTEVVLFGVRSGGVLAGIAASKRTDIGALVLWGAVRSGSAYVREQRMLRVSEAKNFGAEAVFDGEGATEEAAGFSLTGETIAALSKLDLTKLPARPAARALIIARDGMPADEKVKKALEGQGVAVTTETWPGLAAMLVAPHYSVAPPQVIEGVASWLGSAARTDATPAAPPVEITARWRDETAPGVTLEVEEQTLRFGPEGRLFGIVTQPQGAPRRSPAVLLANTGANHHVGPNRMYVELARRLASRGFRVLRMDVSTIGDSDGADPTVHNQPYTRDAVDDVARGAAEVEKRFGNSRYAILGLCSGAYVAFQTSLAGRLPLDAQVLVNPQTFYWKEGDTLDVAPGRIYDQTQHVRRQLYNLDAWKRALTGGIDYKKVGGALLGRAQILAKDLAKSAARRAGVRLPDDVASDLSRIAEKNMETIIVFSHGDPGVDYLQRNAGGQLARLRRRPNFHVDMVEGADHTFTATLAQQRLFDLIDRHFDRLWPTR